MENQCRHSFKRVTICLLSCILVVTVGVCAATRYVINKREVGSYTISRQTDGVTIEFGKILSTRKPLEFTIPLKELGLSAGSIAQVKSSCSCTAAEVGPQDADIKVTFVPNPEKVHVHQTISILPNDKSIGVKVIRVKGELIPAWFAQPPSIVVNNVHPGERRVFSADVRINYELPKIEVKSIRLDPQTDNLNLTSRITNSREFVVSGVVNGRSQPFEYRGEIEIGFGSGPYEKVILPIEINHMGAIIADPHVVTLSKDRREAVIVVFKHYEKAVLSVEKIDCPEYLEVNSLGYDEGKFALKIGIRSDRVIPQQLTTAKVKVKFKGIAEARGEVRVVTIPRLPAAAISVL